MAESQLDVLSVGNVVNDIFIRLLDDQAKLEDSAHGPTISMPYGAKVPFDFSEKIVAVGNAPNAAVAFSRLGLKSGLASNVGEDDDGRDIIKQLQKSRVDTRFVHINPGKKSQTHFVLWYKEDRTILVRDQIDYEYHWPRFRIIDLPKWIYFSSVGKSAVEYDDAITHWLEAHPAIKLALQPGTFQIQTGTERLKRLYARTQVLAVNREEAATIVGGHHDNVHALLDKLHELGPKVVVISDGHAGAYASDGVNRYKMPIYPDPKPPFERTGAGDAFTSTFVAAMIHGADIAGALLWAPINPMSVVQKVGAQAGLLTQKEIEHFLRIAPESYHPERLR
ncbi:MAG TPA: carbohydrate kinase family protein [Candidatus Saccharimonadales bacterium]|nr:carbohydrate kinase family protein [Candidatus Saccharimonadales bacterium]